MKYKEEFITSNFEETQKLGKEFITKNILNKGKISLKNNIIALYGDLGSGKTTFVQGMALGFGIKRRILSPTFIIVRTYRIRIKNQELRIKNFYHIDLYRVETENDIKALGIEEIIKDPQNIIAIEWAEKMENLLPKEKYHIEFEHIPEDKRRIIIS